MSKIILASGSAARQSMLKNAGLEFNITPADIDEEKIISTLQETGASASNIALTLAQEKARAISLQNNEAYVIGSDQLLSMDDVFFSKAKNRAEARQRLESFAGNEHFLTSAVCVMKGGQDIWHKVDAAALQMKPLSAQALDKYIEIAGDTLTHCVGCYALEGAGIRLFRSIRGDYFTILGMPLLPLLNFLEGEGVIS